MVVDPVFVTPEGHEKLAQELRHLIEVRRPEVAALIGDAKNDGDVSENAAYDEAKEQQAFVEGRIRHVEDILARAEIIKDTAVTDSVTIGCQVTIAEDGADPERFRIVGSAEANPSDGLISNESPLGRALLGKRKGEAASFVNPDGEKLTFHVLSID